LSRVMGNYHARFLGDGVAAMPLCYPDFLLISENPICSVQILPKISSNNKA
jgi:hypothetical protein